MPTALHDRPCSTVPHRCAALLAAGLLVACASASQGTAADRDGATPAPAEATDRRSGCAGDCSLRVENRLGVDVEVGTDRPPSPTWASSGRTATRPSRCPTSGASSWSSGCGTGRRRRSSRSPACVSSPVARAA